MPWKACSGRARVAITRARGSIFGRVPILGLGLAFPGMRGAGQRVTVTDPPSP